MASSECREVGEQESRAEEFFVDIKRNGVTLELNCICPACKNQTEMHDILAFPVTIYVQPKSQSFSTNFLVCNAMPASDYGRTTPLYPLDLLLPRYPKVQQYSYQSQGERVQLADSTIQKYGLVVLLILNLAVVSGWQQIPHFAIATLSVGCV